MKNKYSLDKDRNTAIDLSNTIQSIKDRFMSDEEVIDSYTFDAFNDFFDPKFSYGQTGEIIDENTIDLVSGTQALKDIPDDEDCAIYSYKIHSINKADEEELLGRDKEQVHYIKKTCCNGDKKILSDIYFKLHENGTYSRAEYYTDLLPVMNKVDKEIHKDIINKIPANWY